MGCYAAEAAALGKLKARIGQIRPGDASFATWRLILLTLTLSFEITNTQVLSCCYCIFEKSSSSGPLSKELFLSVRRTPRTQRESEWRCLWPAKISHSLWVYFNAASNQCGNLNRQVFLSFFLGNQRSLATYARSWRRNSNEITVQVNNFFFSIRGGETCTTSVATIIIIINDLRLCNQEEWRRCFTKALIVA